MKVEKKYLGSLLVWQQQEAWVWGADVEDRYGSEESEANPMRSEEKLTQSSRNVKDGLYKTDIVKVNSIEPAGQLEGRGNKDGGVGDDWCLELRRNVETQHSGEWGDDSELIFCHTEFEDPEKSCGVLNRQLKICN
jgi:hypothetical protein